LLPFTANESRQVIAYDRLRLATSAGLDKEKPPLGSQKKLITRFRKPRTWSESQPLTLSGNGLEFTPLTTLERYISKMERSISACQQGFTTRRGVSIGAHFNLEEAK
jgi:hypothetical protein